VDGRATNAGNRQPFEHFTKLLASSRLFTSVRHLLPFSKGGRRAIIIVVAAAVAASAAVAMFACGRLVPRAPGPGLQAVAPQFQLLDQSGNSVALSELTAAGPAVVVFYRGHW